MTFLHPVFRSGRVVSVEGDQSLTHLQAKAVQESFNPKSEYYDNKWEDRYKECREGILKSFNPDFEWPDKPLHVKITHKISPIISIENIKLNWKGFDWIFRDSFTVCFAKAKFKLWFSASVFLPPKRSGNIDIDSHELDTIDKLHQTFMDQAIQALDGLMHFCEDSLHRLMKIHKAFERNAKPFELKSYLEANICCMGTSWNITPLIQKIRDDGRRAFFSQSYQGMEEEQRILREFLRKTGRQYDKDPTKMKGYIATSIPDPIKRSNIDNVRTNSIDYKPRVSYIIPKVEKQNSIEKELYKSIGFESPQFRKIPELMNTEMCSRGIAFEIGRVY